MDAATPKTPAEVVDHIFADALQHCERLAERLKELKTSLDTGQAVADRLHAVDEATNDLLQKVTAFRAWADTVRRVRKEFPVARRLRELEIENVLRLNDAADLLR